MDRISAKECREFFRIVTEKAEEMGIPVSIAVVDGSGHLVALERMDNAGFITPETAHSKAYTMAAFRSMSPRFTDGIVIQKWFKERNPQMLMIASVFSNGRVAASGGCAPIFKGDVMVGAFGISGATGDQDQIIADYARAAIGWAAVPEHDDTPEEVKRHVNEIYEKVGITDRRR